MLQYKRLFIPILPFAAVFLLFSTSCKKGWLDVNYNPLELTDSSATPDLVLPSIMMEWPGASITGLSWESFMGALPYWMGYWCDPNDVPGSEQQTYLYARTVSTPGPNKNVALLENKATRTGQDFYTGIAKIIKAIMWSKEVSVLNNVPYFEAFTDIRQPKYDDGQAIYEDLIKQLDTAIVLIKNAESDKNPKISIADIMFHGEKDKWIRFANTVKLRLLMHQANLSSRTSYIEQEIAVINAEGSGFLQSGEDASVNPGFDQQRPNEFFYFYYRYHPWSYKWPEASANIIAMNFLKENNDPRLSFFYSPAELTFPAGEPEPFPQPGPDNFRGNMFGLPINEAVYPYQSAGYVSQVGGIPDNGPVTPFSTGILKGYDMDIWIFTSIESLFLQAEAVYRNLLPGNPEEAYKDAVKESFRWLNVGGNSTVPDLSDQAFEDWYNQEVAANNPNVSWQAAPDKYKLLMFQKYLAFNGIEPLQAWVDYRRNGAYPEIPLSASPGRIGNVMPLRFTYSSNEYMNNAENTTAQGTIDVFTSKIWWMP